MKTDTRYTTQSQEVLTTAAKRPPVTRVSRGGLDEINPENIVHGEYSDNQDEHGAWLDVVYLDDDILRTHSGKIRPDHPLAEELKILLRDDTRYYAVTIREVTAGFAFKRTDIMDISVSSLMQGTDRHLPSCVWNLQFEDGSLRTLEVEYQSYFAYGNTVRPQNATNIDILAKTFPDIPQGKAT